MATIDDFLREQQNTNDLLRELLNNYSGAGSEGGPGVGPIRRRGSGRHSGGGPDLYRNIRYRQDEDPKSVEELIEQYERIEELEIGRFKRMKEQKKTAKEFLDTHKDELDKILEKQARGEDLSEREIELYREGTEAVREYGEA